jgi:hypothetical protein
MNMDGIKIPLALKKMTPEYRKQLIDKEGNDQVVRNEYEKAVSTKGYDGTLNQFAKERGMRVRDE